MTPLRYLLYPPKIEAEVPYPLIIFLHGVGERGDDLELVKKYGLPHYVETSEVKLPAYIAVPQCPADVRWHDELEALDAMLDDLLAQNPIDPSRVYLTGFSLGGFGTWAWALRSPERFAAIMPVGGSGFLTDELERLKNKPIWIVHSAADPVVSIRGADEIAVSLARLGSNFGYLRYPDATHGQTSDRAFADMALYRWMLAQKLDA